MISNALSTISPTNTFPTPDTTGYSRVPMAAEAGTLPTREAITFRIVALGK
jgi:hypothetical protein